LENCGFHVQGTHKDPSHTHRTAPRPRELKTEFRRILAPFVAAGPVGRENVWHEFLSATKKLLAKNAARYEKQTRAQQGMNAANSTPFGINANIGTLFCSQKIVLDYVLCPKGEGASQMKKIIRVVTGVMESFVHYVTVDNFAQMRNTIESIIGIRASIR